MLNVDEIAAACPDRMEAMIFGVADYAASMQSHTASIGGVDENYAVLTDPNGRTERDRHWGDQWHYPLARIAVACRAYGLRPIDGPYGDFTDPEGYLAAARRAAVLGYEGKWAIHPSQVAAGERGLHAGRRGWSSARAGSSRRWRRRRRRARAPSRSTAG